jgi:hypothetical protein
MGGPLIGAKAGLSRLRERPESKMFHALQLAGVEIAAGIFFERQSQSLGIKLAACGRMLNDWAKTGDEKYIDIFWGFHSLNSLS